MSLSSDNFTALIHLRDQARKWKNITFVTIIIMLVFLGKVVFSNSVEKNLGSDKNFIATIEIKGIIFSNNYRSKVLKNILEKDNIKAVIVNINSPGGSIVGSEILYNELLQISKKKPVVAVLGSIAASGGYMAALGTDYIIAHNGTLTGSIGVIMQSTEVTQLAENLGVKFQNYKSSHLKGSPSPFEKTDAEIDGMVNESVQDSYQFFIDLVLKEREGKISKKNVKKVIDGRVFTGRQAFKVGLVDEVGSSIEAINYLKEKHQITNLEVKEISLNRIENKFLDKILNHNAALDFLSGNISGKKLMAVY